MKPSLYRRIKNLFKKEESILPHEKYPEILEWIPGDILSVYHGYPLPPFRAKYAGFDGFLVILISDNHYSKTHIKYCNNLSLRDRKTELVLKDAYNQFLGAVQEEVKKLSEDFLK